MGCTCHSVIWYNNIWKMTPCNKSQKNNTDVRCIHSGLVAESGCLTALRGWGKLGALKILNAGPEQRLSLPEVKHMLDSICLQKPDTEKLKCLMFFCGVVKQIQGNLYIAVGREFNLGWNSSKTHTWTSRGIIHFDRMCTCVLDRVG